MDICCICGSDLTGKNRITIESSVANGIHICESCIRKMYRNVKTSDENVKFQLPFYNIMCNRIIETYARLVIENCNNTINEDIAKLIFNHLYEQNDNDVQDDKELRFYFKKCLGILSRTIEEYYLYINKNNEPKNIESFLEEIAELYRENTELYKNALHLITDFEEVPKNSDRLNRYREEIKNKHYKETKEEKNEETEIILKTPSTIKSELDKYVIGQERAKKIISVAIYNHYKRIKSNKKNIAKSNIMMIGSTGVGKTEIARSVAKILDLPFVIADSTSMTETGYVGGDVEDMLLHLITAADGDIEKAENGIIYIDEIDKIARNSEGGKDVGGESVQQALLKIVEGNEIIIKLKSGHSEKRILFDTSKILFICGGAFEGLTMKEEGPEKVTLGFNTIKEESEETEKIDAKTLMKYGMIPEFVGRFPVIVKLEDLTVEDLKRILVEPEGSVIKQYKELIDLEDIELEFTDRAIEYIAEKAFENHTGARGLKAIVEDKITDLMYELPDEKDVKKVQVGISKGELCFRKM